MTLENKRILLIITGGIAAYKSLEFIRLIKKSGGHVQCVLTKGGSHFVTALTVSALSENKCYTDLWSLDDESNMGHIRLSRESDVIMVAPASADFIGKVANGLCDDLASTILMATNKPVIMAPAMNPEMFNNPALQNNLNILRSRGMEIIDPAHGDMACGETGQGRLPEPSDLLTALNNFFNTSKPLQGKTALVTSGPTFEPIDPVRFIGNRSSGKQGHAIASELAKQGADVTYITGPTALDHPTGCKTIQIETAQQMMDAVNHSLPTDIAICAAAVADYGVDALPQKQKKAANKDGLDIQFKQNPDILHTIATHQQRPAIVIGFAAETENLIDNARQKLNRKQCDAIVANLVGDNLVFGSDQTSVHWITKSVHEHYDKVSKIDVAVMIARQLMKLTNKDQKDQAA